MLASTQVLQRALQYAATQWLHRRIAPAGTAPAKGVRQRPLATRMGLSGIPVAAETIALHTIFELPGVAATRTCAASPAARGGAGAPGQGRGTCGQLRRASPPCSPDVDIGYFDSRAPSPLPLRQQRDRDALAAALADGTIDALSPDHTPVDEDAKALPFAEAEPGATGLSRCCPSP